MRELGISVPIEEERKRKPFPVRADIVVFEAAQYRHSFSEYTHKREISETGETEGRRIIHAINAKEALDWETIEGEPLLYVLQEVAGAVPVPLITTTILHNPSSVMPDNHLGQLYHHAYKKRNKAEGETPIEYLCRKAGVELKTEDIIVGLGLDMRIIWKKVPSEIQKDILELASEELREDGVERGVKEFTEQEFSRNYRFLNNRSLRGIYHAAKIEPERGQQGIIPYLLDKLGYEHYSVENVIDFIKSDKQFRWEQIDVSTIQGVLSLIAQKNKKSIYGLTYKDLTNEYDFLDGRTPLRIYEHYQRDPERGEKDIVDYMYEKLDIVSSLIKDIKEDTPVPWQEMNRSVLRNFVKSLAEDMGIPFSMITMADIYPSRHALIGGKTLRSLSDYIYRLRAKEPEQRPGIEVFREYIDIPEIQAKDVYATMKHNRKITWEEIPHGVLRAIILDMARAQGFSPYQMQANDFLRNYPMVDNRNFRSLYAFAQSLGNRGDRSIIDNFFWHIGIFDDTFVANYLHDHPDERNFSQSRFLSNIRGTGR